VERLGRLGETAVFLGHLQARVGKKKRELGFGQLQAGYKLRLGLTANASNRPAQRARLVLPQGG